MKDGLSSPSSSSFPSSVYNSIATSASSSSSYHPLRSQFIAASTGSLVSTIMLNPVSVVKIRLQSKSQTGSISAIVKSIYRKNGIGGYWYGTRAGLMQGIPSTVVYMTTYESCKRRLSRVVHPSTAAASIIPAIAAGVARVIAVTVTSPFELARTLQSNQSGAGANQKGVLTVIKGVLRIEGVSGLYKGYASTLMRDVPFSSFYWYVFETLKPKYTKFFMGTPDGTIGSKRSKNVDSDISINSDADRYNDGYSNGSLSMVSFAAAATAGMMASLLTHPFDVLKTRQQLSELSVGSGSNNSISEVDLPSKMIKVKSNMDISLLYREGGIRALYKGIHLRMAIVVPAGAIMITVYEAVKRMDL